MRKTPIIALAAGLAVLASCIPTDVCGCPPMPPMMIIVEGSVEDPSGAPVAGAEVTLQHFSPTCADAHVADFPSHVTGTEGRWEFGLSELPPPACFLVRATGPAGSGLGSAEATLQHSVAAPLPFGTEPEVPRIEITLRLPGDSLAATPG